MPVELAPHQLAFYQELFAPFPNELLSTTRRGGRELTYVDKRAISNRLDSVCGPHNWYCGYTETKEGFMCHLSIVCPMATPGEWKIITKSDGAGPEEMGSKNKTTGEFEVAIDDNQKSAFTNAFRRAGQDAWGIGRYLYNKGVPTWMNSRPSATCSPAPAAPPPPRNPETGHGNGGTPNRDAFRVPKTGKSVFAWAKGLESHFSVTVVNGMIAESEKRGWGKFLGDLNEAQVGELCADVIGYMKSLDHYNGEFGERGAPAKIPPEVTTTGPDLKGLRRRVADLAQKLLFIQFGSAPEPAQISEAIADISTHACGTSLSPLKLCVNPAAMVQTIDEMERFIKQAQSAGVPGPAEEIDDIPF